MNTEIKKITEIMNHEMFDLCADLKRCDISDILNGHFEVDSLGSETLDDLQMRKWLFLELLREDEKEEVLGKICLKNNTKLSLVLLELSEQFDRKNGEFKYTEDEEELICPHCNRNEEECEKNTESGEITRCIRCDKCYVGDCGLTSCYCFDEEYQRECGEGYCSICEEACHLCYRIIDGEPDDTAPMCKYCLAKLEDEEEEDEKEDVGCTDC